MIRRGGCRRAVAAGVAVVVVVGLAGCTGAAGPADGSGTEAASVGVLVHEAPAAPVEDPPSPVGPPPGYLSDGIFYLAPTVIDGFKVRDLRYDPDKAELSVAMAEAHGPPDFARRWVQWVPDTRTLRVLWTGSRVSCVVTVVGVGQDGQGTYRVAMGWARPDLANSYPRLCIADFGTWGVSIAVSADASDPVTVVVTWPTNEAPGAMEETVFAATTSLPGG